MLGETGLSEHAADINSSDEEEPEYLEWPRGNVGVAGEGEARSEDDELRV